MDWESLITDAHNLTLLSDSKTIYLMHLLIHFLYFFKKKNLQIYWSICDLCTVSLIAFSYLTNSWGKLVIEILIFFFKLLFWSRVWHNILIVYVYRCWFFYFLLLRVIRVLYQGIYIHQRKSFVMTLRFLLILGDDKHQAFSSLDLKK